MKKVLFLLLFIVSCFAASAQITRVYSTGDVLISSNTDFDISVNSFPKNTTGLIVEVIYKKMDDTQENLTAVQLYNSVTVDGLALNPEPLLLDSLTYNTGDGLSISKFEKIDFYSSALKLDVVPSGGVTDTSTVQINLWSLEQN